MAPAMITSRMKYTRIEPSWPRLLFWTEVFMIFLSFSRQDGDEVCRSGPIKGHGCGLDVDGLITVRSVAIHDSKANDARAVVGNGENLGAGEVSNACGNQHSLC